MINDYFKRGVTAKDSHVIRVDVHIKNHSVCWVVD